MTTPDPSSPPPVELEYASKTQPPPKAKPLPLDPKVKKSLFRMFFSAIGLLLALLIYCIIISGVFGVVIFHPSIPVVFILASIVGSILLLTLSIRLLNRRRIELGLLSLFLALISLPYIYFIHQTILLTWASIDSTIAPNGSRFELLLMHIPEQETTYYAIASPKYDLLILKTYNIHAKFDPYDVGLSNSVIRPVGNLKLLSIRNNLFCVQTYMGMYLFDSNTFKLLLDDSYSITTPWILMDDSSEVFREDEEEIIKNYWRYFKNNQPILDALKHSNPNVRESAARVLKALGVESPATRPVEKQ